MALNSEIARKQTKQFISERPVDITISRATRVRTETGGFTDGSASPLPPQTVRKTVSTRTSDSRQFTTANGNLVIPQTIIIGMPDLDIQRGDTFEIGGVLHEVLEVNRIPDWRTRAEVFEHVH